MIEILTAVATKKKVESGQKNFLVPGTFEFVVPPGITTLKVLVIAAGGGAGITQRFGTDYGIYQTGSGGGLAYSNNLAVTPGQVWNVVVPAGHPVKALGSAANPVRPGGNAYIQDKSSGITFVQAIGGDNGGTWAGEKYFTGGNAFHVTTSSDIKDTYGGNAATFTRNGLPSKGQIGLWYSGTGTDLYGRLTEDIHFGTPGVCGGGAGIKREGRTLMASAQGGVRIMWDDPDGHQRSYPSDSGDV